MSDLRRLLAPTLLLCLLFPLPTFGNPVRLAGLHTHVQNANPSSWPNVTNCDQLVVWTPALGALEFDLFLELRFEDPPYNIDRLHFELDWPAGWSFTGYEVAYENYCTETVAVAGNHATVDLSWSVCPPRPYQLLRIMRCFVTAPDYGRFQVSEGSSPLLHICTPDDYYTDFDAYGATAGVVCAHGPDTCPRWYGYCSPQAELPVVELQVAQGETLVELLPFMLHHTYGSPCAGTCSGSENWMSVSCPTGQVWDDFPVTLEVDTAGLAPGQYSGWVRVDSDGARACTLVELTVMDLTAVQDASWSLVKSRY